MFSFMWAYFVSKFQTSVFFLNLEFCNTLWLSFLKKDDILFWKIERLKIRAFYTKETPCSKFELFFFKFSFYLGENSCLKKIKRFVVRANFFWFWRKTLLENLNKLFLILVIILAWKIELILILDLNPCLQNRVLEN